MNGEKVATHTPGPWAWVGYYLYGPDSKQVMSGGTAYGDPCIDFENEADKVLVTAAPDLLAACEALQPVLESLALGGWVDSPSGNSVAADKRDMLRAAIAKAKEGGS